jgi:hypothetical protein
MSVSAKATTVVAGEAIESDDEDLSATPPWNLATAPAADGVSDQRSSVPQLIADMPSSSGIVVSGEASESDEECQQLDIPLHIQLSTNNPNAAPVDDQKYGSSDSPSKRLQLDSPAYDSLLHRKLRETNIAIRSRLEGIVQKQFETATKNLQSTGQQLTSSQLMIQQVSHTMRLLTNDLFQLEDKIDIVVTCSILPHVSVVV